MLSIRAKKPHKGRRVRDMIKRYGDTIFIQFPDDTACIEYTTGTDPRDLTPAFMYACELGYQHGDTIHLPDEGFDVVWLSR